MLSKFWLLKGWESFGESAKNGKFMTKIFFRQLNNKYKKLQKMVSSADVKADVKQQQSKESKEQVAVSCNFLQDKKYLQNVK